MWYIFNNQVMIGWMDTILVIAQPCINLILEMYDHLKIKYAIKSSFKVTCKIPIDAVLCTIYTTFRPYICKVIKMLDFLKFSPAI